MPVFDFSDRYIKFFESRVQFLLTTAPIDALRMPKLEKGKGRLKTALPFPLKYRIKEI